MMTFYLIVLLAVLSWKGYYAWRRGVRTYRQDRRDHDSLREWLLGNGATQRQSLWPFYRHALQRAFRPLLSQWRLLLVLLLLGVVVMLLSAARPKKAEENANDLTAVRMEQPTTYLHRYAYKCWYNEELRIPLAVSWYLTGDHVSGNFKRKGVAFHPDYDVKGSPVTTQDYMQSGYDRGHMCPSGDNKWHQTAQEQSFLMTNICPQNHNLNKNDWNDLEQLCRTWARRYDKVYIVCGPVLRGSKHKTIGKQRNRRITVPEAFYKVVLRLDDHPAAIGFVYENNGVRQPMKDAVRTVDEIEELTGIDFFYALDDQLETNIEATASLKEWENKIR